MCLFEYSGFSSTKFTFDRSLLVNKALMCDSICHCPEGFQFFISYLGIFIVSFCLKIFGDENISFALLLSSFKKLVRSMIIYFLNVFIIKFPFLCSIFRFTHLFAKLKDLITFTFNLRLSQLLCFQQHFRVPLFCKQAI